MGRSTPWQEKSLVTIAMLQTPEGQGKSKCLRQADFKQQQHLHAGGSAARKSSVLGVRAL